MQNQTGTPGARRTISLLILFTVIATVLPAQSAIEVSLARVVQTGGDSVLLRALAIDGDLYDVAIQAGEGGEWTVTTVRPHEPGILPDDLYLDLTRLSVVGPGELRLDDVLVGTQFVSGTITFADDLSRVESFRFEPTAPPQNNPLLLSLLEMLDALPAVDASGESAGAGDEPETTPQRPEGAETAADQPDEMAAPALNEPDPSPPVPDAPASEDPTIAAGADPEVPEEGGSVDRTDVGDETDATTEMVGIAQADVREVEILLDAIVARINGVEATIEAFADAADLRADRMERRILEAIERAVIAGGSRLEAIERVVNAGEQRLDTLIERVEDLAEEHLDLRQVVLDTADAGAERLDSVERAIDAIPAPGEPAEAAVDLTDHRSPTASLASARAEFDTLERIDLSASVAATGRWITEENRAIQSSPDAYFAKLRLDYVQDSRPRLYRMLVRAVDPGWAGVGIHLSVAGVNRPTGYGHGESLLVWLTRDESAYGNERTYLEVYSSYDDVRMDRVAQAQTDADLGDLSAVEILVDPGAQFITLAVDGREYVRYRFAVPQGMSVELALRSLGRAEFRTLEARRR